MMVTRWRSGSETAEVRHAVLRYLLYGAVALVVVSVPTFVALSRIAEHHALQSAAEDGASIARRLLAPAVTAGLLAADPDAIAAMDRRLTGRMSDGSLARVKIWTRDGTIIYSDEHSLIGRRYPSNPDLAGLVPGAPPVSAISDLDEPENVFERASGGLVEVYTLPVSTNGIDVVYEMYFPLVRVERERNQLVSQMVPVGMLALGTLALSQLPLAIGLARRVTSIRRSRLRMLAQTVKAVELERHRLAQDLHDDVIQDLSGVAVTLESVGRSGRTATSRTGQQTIDRDVAHTVERTAQILRRDVQLLRDIVANLFPVTTHDGGLDASIRELAAVLVQQGLRVNLELDPDPGVDPVTAGLVHRVTREAMVNVSKHAEASTVDVDLVITSDSVELRVSDNGRGTDPGGPHRTAGHVGLDIVRETISEAGGTVDVIPRRPHGTTVRAILPR
ncbi:hypothetical protein GCM10009867_32810 [Pedococcus aerophilus]|uniref:Histidine kinase domain-containing protein n=1 Tax=Pedococcus aerophilus TaxID=436356 RepID=A0ABN3UVB7_9MICO